MQAEAEDAWSRTGPLHAYGGTDTYGLHIACVWFLNIHLQSCIFSSNTHSAYPGWPKLATARVMEGSGRLILASYCGIFWEQLQNLLELTLKLLRTCCSAYGNTSPGRLPGPRKHKPPPSARLTEAQAPAHYSRLPSPAGAYSALQGVISPLPQPTFFPDQIPLTPFHHSPLPTNRKACSLSPNLSPSTAASHQPFLPGYHIPITRSVHSIINIRPSSSVAVSISD